MIKVRPYQMSDQDQIEQLFYDTVHEINSRDYSQEQINLWVEQGKKIGFPDRWKKIMLLLLK